MTYLVLARKYRPRSFDTLIGQDHVVRALTHALDTQRLHHAWLFTGTRGVGKTTLSRILAKSLNCETGITSRPCGVCQACRDIDAGRFVDYVELDAASNRGVDEMTQLLEQAVYAPSVGRFKVYMIDEVHMLTGHAFNAMLKTLEEPPAHVKFIIATTDPQKIPVTVLSRCLQFNLKQMPPDAIVGHLTQVLIEEQIPCEAPALRLIAQAAGGSMRDALSLTDQAIAYSAGSVTEEAVRGMLGTIDQRHLVRLLQALGQGQAAAVIDVADELAMRGLSYSGALADLSSLLSRVAIARRVPGALDPSDPLAGDIVALAGQLHPDTVQLFYSVAVHSRQELALAPDEYAGFVMACLRMLALVSEAGPVDMPAPSTAASGPVPSAPAPSLAASPPIERSAAPASAASPGDMPITHQAAQPASARAEQAQADPVQAGQAQTDPVQSDQTATNPLQADHTPTNPLQVDHTPTDPLQVEHTPRDPVQVDRTTANPAHADQAYNQPALAEQARAILVQAESVQANHVSADQAHGDHAPPALDDQAPVDQSQYSPASARQDESPANQSLSRRGGSDQVGASDLPHVAPGEGAAPPPWDDASTAQAAPPKMRTPAEALLASAVPESPTARQPTPGIPTSDESRMPTERAKPADDLPSWVSEDIPDDATGPADQAFMASGDDDDEFETLSDEPFEVPPVAGRPIAAAPSVRSGKRHRLPKLADMTPQQWPELAASLPVTGLAAEVARQSEWLGATDDTIRLRVAVKTLADSASRIRLQTVLCEHYGRAVRIDVVVGVTGEATAHAVAQSVRLANQQAAEQAVADDPFVNALMADFGAHVVPASIRHVGGVAGV